jgi:hypothetical protein
LIYFNNKKFVSYSIFNNKIANINNLNNNNSIINIFNNKDSTCNNNALMKTIITFQKIQKKNLKIMLQMMDYFQIIFILLTMILNLVQLMI